MKKSGYVYWIQVMNVEGQPIKQGYTCRKIFIRLREWQSLMPFLKLEFLGKERSDDPENREQFLKEVFEEYMILPEASEIASIKKSEWFRPGERLLRYISQQENVMSA